MMRVSLFVTCLTDLFYPDVAEALVRVMHRLGVQVDFPQAQSCCGQPALNSGYEDEARAVAARMIEVFEPAETVVTPSGSCCSVVREHYPHLFHDEPVMLGRALALADKTFEIVEFLEKVLKVDWSKWNLCYPEAATYHYSCHLRGLGMTDEAVKLMGKIGGLEHRPLEKVEQCCGFGGTFAVKYPEISGSMVRDKVDCIRATGARMLVCNDGGCTMNIEGAMRRQGVNLPVKHIVQILDEAMAQQARAE
jgi:L-lactate dehydrogenase complex protein LldE